ncbi:MAG: hypothetical protein COB50_04880 [Thiotrichales bacterium]|nr:MAG: hypothetical protein COB50_04880 [Thiotrichales bacterium]
MRLYNKKSLIVALLMVANMQYAFAAPSIQSANINKAFSDNRHLYSAHVDMGSFYQNKGNSFGSANLFIPLAQTTNSLWFANVRGLDRSGPSAEGNFGLGYRSINHDNSYLWGMYGFFDVRRSVNRNYFRQITLGGELRTDHWSYRINGYLPVGKTTKNASGLNYAELNPISGNQSNILFHKGKETALKGFDIEIGRDIYKGLTAYVGGYYFTAHDVKDVVGPRARLSYALYQPHNSMLKRITFETMVQHDSQRGTNWYAGIRVRIGIGIGNESNNLSRLQQHMTDYIYRDPDIVTGRRQQPLQKLFIDGHAAVVRQVENEAELKSASEDSDVDIIGVNGEIKDVNTVTLQNNQTLTGGNYSFTNAGQTYNVAAGHGGSLFAESKNDLIRVTKNNTIRDIKLTGSGLQVIENTGGPVITRNKDVGTLNIENVTMKNGGVAITVADGTNNDSKISISNSSVDMTATGTNGIGIRLDATNGSKIIISKFSGNTLTTGGSSSEGIQSTANGVGSVIEFEDMSGNTITTTGANAIGILMDARNAGKIKVSKLYGNHITTKGSSAEGIQNIVNANSSIELTWVANNTIKTDGKNAAGIQNIANGANSVIDFTNIVGNTITTDGIGSIGMRMDARNAAKISIAEFVGNEIVTSGPSAEGIQNTVDGSGSDITISDMLNNILSTKGTGAASIKNMAANSATINFTNMLGNAIITDGDTSIAMLLDARSSATISISKFSGNEISTSGYSAASMRNTAASNATINFTDISNNKIITDGANSIAMMLDARSAGKISISNLFGNEIITSGYSAEGIQNTSSGSGSDITISDMLHNTISTNGTNAAGVKNTASSSATINFTDISDNTITTDGDYSIALMLDARSAGKILISKLVSNEITSDGYSAEGMQNTVNGNDSDITLTDVLDNVIKTSGRDSIAIRNLTSGTGNSNTKITYTNFIDNKVSATDDSNNAVADAISNYTNATGSSINYGTFSNNTLNVSGGTAHGIDNRTFKIASSVNFGSFTNNNITVTGNNSNGILNNANTEGSSIHYTGVASKSALESANNITVSNGNKIEDTGNVTYVI